MSYPALTFDRVAHRYALESHGTRRELPGVTAVLKSAGLIDDRFFLEDARRRGQYVHLATHYLDDGDLAEESIGHDFRGYIDAYRAFCSLTQPSWTYVEWRVCDPVTGYAGTLDRAGLLTLNGTKAIVDVKSGTLPPWTALQLAAYRRCLPEPHTWTRLGLQLKADGGFSVEEFTDSRDDQRFLGALELYQWKREHLKHVV